MGIKVLFIYPNTYGMNMVPPAIALFSALLKRDGHKVEIFDSTYYAIDYGIDSDGSQVDKLSVVPFDMGERGIRLKTTVWEDDLKEQVNRFKPDLLAMSTTEDMWELGLKILDVIKDYKIKNKIPTIAGGVFPTFAPEIAIKQELVDIVCVGEGENALVDLCKRIEKKEDYTNLTNCWVKTIGPEYLKNRNVIRKNPIAKPVDMNGPMGVFETESFAKGTNAIATYVSEMTQNGGTSIIGGGDSASAIKDLGVWDDMTHISTGGGASLELLSGVDLPAFKVLRMI